MFGCSNLRCFSLPIYLSVYLSIYLSMMDLSQSSWVLDNQPKQEFFIPEAARIQRGVKEMEMGCHE